MRVDIESDRLYWVNQASATIQYIDLQTEKVFTVSMRSVEIIVGTYVHVGDGLTTAHAQVPLAAGARPAALDVFAGELLWADGAALRACGRDRCERPRLLRNDTGNRRRPSSPGVSVARG